MEAFHDGTSSMGGYIRRTADQSIFAIMDSSQWAYALFDAGCWGYASVTISTLAPLVFVRRIRRSPVQRFAADIREWGEQKEAAITNQVHRVGDAFQQEFTASNQAYPHMLDSADAAAPSPAMSEAGFDLKLGDATGTWVMMVAVSTLLAGIACPIIGTLADRYSARKSITFVTAGLSVVLMTMFAYTSRETDLSELLAVIGLAMMFTSIMHCFYNSLLMMVSGRHDIVKVACLQCTVGAWGSAVLMFMLGMHTIQDEEDMDRSYILYCFIFSGIWFLVLALPMWFLLEEEVSEWKGSLHDTFASSWLDTLKSLHNVELIKFLVALMLFNDATSTLHAVYMVYGAQIGLPIGALMLGAVFNRVVGGVAALAWLGVAQFADARICFLGCILIALVSIAVCAWMTTVTEFYIVVLTMTTASSGTFVFSKVLMAMLTPKHKASHNFGFMGMMNRVAGFIGPFLFSTLAFLYNEKAGFIGLILMALAGLVIITTVDFEKGYDFSLNHGGTLPVSLQTDAAAKKDLDPPLSPPPAPKADGDQPEPTSSVI